MNCINCGEAVSARYKFCPVSAAPVVPQPDKPPVATVRHVTVREQDAAAAAAPVPVTDHLFETVADETNRRQSYIKVFAVVAVGVVIAGFATAYMVLLPGIGDKVKASTEMELAIRDHFLTVQKRTATDIETYYCDDFYWARVAVETRTDIPNPLLSVRTYAARAVSQGGSVFNVTAVPITSPEMNEPCR